MKNEFDITQFVEVLTEHSVMQMVSGRVRTKRKKLRMSRRELSRRSAVSYASIRRFEETGEISFRSLLRIANALGDLEGFASLFGNEAITSLKDY